MGARWIAPSPDSILAKGLTSVCGAKVRIE